MIDMGLERKHKLNNAIEEITKKIKNLTKFDFSLG